MKLKCLLNTRMNWAMMIPISGHRYIELVDDVETHVLKCRDCGKVSVSFYFDPDERMQEILNKIDRNKL